MFQSTRPRGRTRQAQYHLLSSGTGVSIHASSREDATRPVCRRNRRRSFNPRVLAGGRDTSWTRRGWRRKFQSTRPRGRTRLYVIGCRSGQGSFNPRVLAGGRDTTCNKRCTKTVFQSTRPRGRTRRATCFHNCADDQFQSTRPRGRTRRCIPSGGTRSAVSIHASSREDAT